jgi:methyl-accepting chemotaxis protein
MAAFASLIVALTVCLSWLAYDLARNTLIESIRERGRTLLTAFEADAADKFASADAAWFSTYLQDLTWRDPTIAYGAVVDAGNVVIAHSEKQLEGKTWKLPAGKREGTMKIIERIVPWKKGSALEFTIVIEPGGKPLGALQLGIDYTKEAASLQALARKIAGVGLLLLVLSLLVAYRMSSRITASLGQLTASARAIAGGDLSIEVPDPAHGIEEFRELGKAFNAMTGSLRGILDRIGQSSGRLGAFGEEVSHIIREQAENTSQQATSVSEVTATMEELSRTSQQIAKNAEEVMRTAANSVEVAQAGTTLVQEGVAATGKLKRRILDISSKTIMLNDKSDEIGKVVAMIKEIAGEIHLLALNAAIESAAAGEHGRRFAVVASEVRRLAEKTRESTETIRASVGDIQAAARDTAAVAQDGTREMESWEQTVAAISSAFEEIIRRIETTSEVSAQISMATNQQTSANEQVVRSMHHVAETAQASVRGMNGLAGSADELSGLVEGLCREAEGTRRAAGAPPAEQGSRPGSGT